MKALNKQTAPKSVAPERIIQFGEGNFLRAFVDWIVYNMKQKTDFNSSVVVVQPIERGMAEWLNGQDCLYHVNLQGRLNGEAVNPDPHRLYQPRFESIFTECCIHGACRPARNTFRHLQHNGSRHCFRPELQVQRCSRIFLSGQADPIAVPSFQNLQRRQEQRSHHHALRTDLPERTSSERMYLPIHRIVERGFRCRL